jgi:catechol 2,3-dioxygenase-like lactoylglutathione lyase family enzyme
MPGGPTPAVPRLVRFEHVNLACRSIDATQAFYARIFPDWHVRASGRDGDTGSRWTHFGSDAFYLAFNDQPTQERLHRRYAQIGVNHVGLVIDDGAAMQARLAANGIPYYTLVSPETAHRIYVEDPDGNEVELVEYHPDYPLR